jgi:hypothetical protein
MSKSAIPPTRTIRADHLRWNNAIVISTADDIAAKYNWLKSADRDAEMGALSFYNWRMLILSPGVHRISGTSKLSLDTSYIGITSLTPQSPESTIITRDTGDDYVIEQSCACLSLTGIYALANANTKAALCLNYFNEGTAAVTVSSVSHGKGYTSVQAANIGKDIQAGDAIYLYKAGSIAGAWYSIGYVNSTSDIEVAENLAKTTGVTYEVIPQTSRYQNLILDTSRPSSILASIQQNCSGLYGLGNIGGYWSNIKLGNYCGGVSDYMQIRATMEFVTGGVQCIGIDERGVDIAGIIRDSTFVSHSIGGCGVWGCNISGLIERVNCGSNSFAKGRTISGIIRNCNGGDACFSSPDSPLITDATGTDEAKSKITKVGVFLSNKYYGQNKGRPGLIVYLSGTNCTAGYYEIESIDSDDQVTLTANASSGGAMTGLTVNSEFGQITGKVYNCSSTGGASFANSNSSPSRVTGKVISSYLNDVEVNLP